MPTLPTLCTKGKTRLLNYKIKNTCTETFKGILENSSTNSWTMLFPRYVGCFTSQYLMGKIAAFGIQALILTVLLTLPVDWNGLPLQVNMLTIYFLFSQEFAHFNNHISEVFCFCQVTGRLLQNGDALFEHGLTRFTQNYDF